MKHLRFSFFFTCFLISFTLQAQQNHFIYLQTDNKQAFYVKLDTKIYSSSASGYLIIPKLKAGFYNFTIGFPKNEWPEQMIHCAVEDKDYGYLLKDFGDKGWGFFNLQTLNVVMADENGKKPAVASAAVTSTSADTFSNMLSTVVNDPTIKQNDPPKEAIKKVEKEAIKVAPPVVAVPEKEKKADVISTPDSAMIAAKKSSVADTVKSVPAVVAAPVKEKELVTPALPYSSFITKKATSKTADGMEMVYIDTENGVPDTVTIFIPAGKITTESTVLADTVAKAPELVKKVTAVTAPVAETEKKDAKFLAIEVPNPNAVVQKAAPDTSTQPAVTKSPMINSDCKNFATDDDFMKLRKKMAAAHNADDMIGIAKKIFKTRCFTTEQVKNLSVLFLKDADKYSFFDAGYPFTSDSQNYQLLQGQLTDTYYIDRFKVMIRHL